MHASLVQGAHVLHAALVIILEMHAILHGQSKRAWDCPIAIRVWDTMHLYIWSTSIYLHLKLPGSYKKVSTMHACCQIKFIFYSYT